jgi:hypothetical protein
VASSGSSLQSSAFPSLPSLPPLPRALLLSIHISATEEMPTLIIIQLKELKERQRQQNKQKAIKLGLDPE